MLGATLLRFSGKADAGKMVETRHMYMLPIHAATSTSVEKPV